MKLEDKIPEKNEQYRLQQMDDEHLLYNPLQTKTIYLNPSATLIWQLCDGRNSIHQIIEALTQQYPESKQQIRTDVINSVDELVRNQALSLK